ncbi:MAG: hypothetical protein WKF78_03845 [Candidatus Limnocylindrales bacterium]
MLEGIRRLETRPQRLHLHRASQLVDELIETLRDTPASRGSSPPGRSVDGARRSVTWTCWRRRTMAQG